MYFDFLILIINCRTQRYDRFTIVHKVIGMHAFLSMAFFSDVGAHCRKCKVQDFLPFECDACHLQFCLTHRLYTEHDCKVGFKAKNIIGVICPICNVSLRLYENESADALMEEHLKRFCANKTTKPKRLPTQCVAAKCKESLGTFKCNDCQQFVCPYHRTEQLHACKKKVNTSNLDCIIF